MVKRPSYTSPRSQVVICMSLVSVQVSDIINIIFLRIRHNLCIIAVTLFLRGLSSRIYAVSLCFKYLIRSMSVLYSLHNTQTALIQLVMQVNAHFPYNSE